MQIACNDSIMHSYRETMLNTTSTRGVDRFPLRHIEEQAGVICCVFPCSIISYRPYSHNCFCFECLEGHEYSPLVRAGIHMVVFLIFTAFFLFQKRLIIVNYSWKILTNTNMDLLGRIDVIKWGSCIWDPTVWARLEQLTYSSTDSPDLIMYYRVGL